ncbi:MAG: energy transducer TonB [Saprospiraceae bacterium]
MSLYLFLSLAASCSAQQMPQRTHPVSQEFISDGSKTDNDGTVYYIYKDGMYKEAALTKEPELIGGHSLMETLITLNIRYPDIARQKKIGGTVMVSVVIDADGNLEDAYIHEGIGGGCNDEALRAVRLLDQTGFEPAEIKGKAVTVKYDIPITFLPK